MSKPTTPRDGEPQSLAELMPGAIRQLWKRGRAHREATWTPEEIAHVERLLSDSLKPPRKPRTHTTETANGNDAPADRID